ncbi:dipeptidase [Bacteroidota bacterium]
MNTFNKYIEFSSAIRKISMIVLSVPLIYAISSCDISKEDDELSELTQRICKNSIIIDSHIDWPLWILKNPKDISQKIMKRDFDLIRANKGGLNAALSVIFVNPKYGIDEGRALVDSQINLVVNYANLYPDKFALAKSPDDILKNFDQNLFSIPLCLENGAPIGNDIGYLKYLKDNGFVYITLSHSKSNQICDSNLDTNRIWKGLSPFGFEVINEMNRLGIMIDISHSTDSTVFQALRYSKAPIIASHSSCNHFTPDYERNLSDTLIKAIADKNGIVMINFGSQFLDSICLKNWNYLLNWYDSTGIDEFSKEGIDFTLKYGETHNLYSNSKQLVDHIDHIVKIAGVDYVGIGSDYDGIGYSQPSDLPDVSSYPIIVFELLKRGYTEENINKILSENFFRVWNDVIEIADSLNNI